MDPGFSILLAHLFGDYLWQNDWMASNKGNPPPKGKRAKPQRILLDDGTTVRFQIDAKLVAARDAWDEARSRWYEGHLACTIHCLLYTMAFYMFCWRWVTWQGLLACFAVHWVIDRFGLARKWMMRAGQEKFATGALSPWSIVVVDNTFHLFTSYVIYRLTVG